MNNQKGDAIDAYLQQNIANVEPSETSSFLQSVKEELCALSEATISGLGVTREQFVSWKTNGSNRHP